MRINLNDELAGVSMRVIRAALKKFDAGDVSLDSAKLTQLLGVAQLSLDIR